MAPRTCKIVQNGLMERGENLLQKYLGSINRQKTESGLRTSSFIFDCLSN